MYKINPTSVSQPSWWTGICRVTCKNWPIMNAPVLENGTASGAGVHNNDLIKTVCNYSLFNEEQYPHGVPQFSYLLALLFGIPATLIIVITVFGNFLVLCFKAKVGKRQTMLLIWNLGLADFLVGVFVLPVGVSYVIGRKWPFGRLLCRIWVSCDVIFCTASIVTLCIISVDRYIGVTRPLRYKMIVTKTKVIISIIAIWIFSISILLSTIRYHSDDDECYDPNVCHAGNELEYVVHSVVFAFFLPTLVTLVLYWKIYKVAKRREKGLAQGLILAMGQNFFKECFAVPLRIHCGKDTMSQQQQVIRMHKRVAKTLGVVVSAFVLCWGPFFSLYIIGYQCGGCIPSLVLDITSWLGYCNSMINPVIYAFTVDEFKNTLLAMFCALCRRREIRRASAQSDQFRTPGTRPPANSFLYPPSSTIPRSSRAYSLIPTTDDHGNSLLSPFIKRISTPDRRVSTPDRSDIAKRQTTAKLAQAPAVEKTEDNSLRKRLSKRSKKCSSSVDAISTRNASVRRRTASESPRKKPSKTEDEIHANTGNTPLMPKSPVENGMRPNTPIQIRMDDLSIDDPTVWNAKLYCTLISSQSTGL